MMILLRQIVVSAARQPPAIWGKAKNQQLVAIAYAAASSSSSSGSSGGGGGGGPAAAAAGKLGGVGGVGGVGGGEPSPSSLLSRCAAAAIAALGATTTAMGVAHADAAWRTGAGDDDGGDGGEGVAAADDDEAAADASSSSSSSTTTTSTAQLRADFVRWLEQQGGSFSRVDLRESVSTGAGLGLFSSGDLRPAMRHRWLGRRVGALLLPQGERSVAVAEVPLELALTAAAARADPELGASYSELMDLGLLDERGAVVAMLAVERARGSGSRYAPWLRLLPPAFETPLWFDEHQRSQLRGTALADAAAVHERALRAQFERLRPALEAMLRQVGVGGGGGGVGGAPPPPPALSFEDYLWAHSVFWSRGQSLPVPIVAGGSGSSSSGSSTGSGGAGRSDEALLQIVEESDDGNEGGGSISGGGGGGGGGDGRGGATPLRIEVWEGIVPGVDFANHSASSANCWWEVAVDGDRGSGSGRRVQLLTNRATLPKRAGVELTISYGDKSNEELMMLHGFSLPGNPHDQLMLPCPLPPRDEWGNDVAARLALLQSRGLRPQIFLPAAHLLLAAEAPSPSPSRAGRGRVGRGAGSAMPPEARRVLEVFVMEPSELAARLELAERGEDEEAALAFGSGGGGDGGGGGGGGGDLLEALGADMALATTLVRLLELAVLRLEGDDEGTGPLEADEARLEADDAARLAPWLRAALVYRAGQKRLARLYLSAARAELQGTLRRLQEAEGAAGGSSGGGGGGGEK